MPKAQAFLLSPSLGWSHRGRRGQTSSNRSRETPEHSAALFLLSLSCPHAAIHRRHTFIHAPPPRTPPRTEAQEDERMPDHGRWKRSHECSICPKKFRTGRALGGHMKSHLERDLKGRIVKKKIKKISSLGLGLELSFGLGSSPFSRTPQAFSGAIEEKMNEEEAHD